jgi:hypothetical protein
MKWQSIMGDKINQMGKTLIHPFKEKWLIPLYSVIHDLYKHRISESGAL